MSNELVSDADAGKALDYLRDSAIALGEATERATLASSMTKHIKALEMKRLKMSIERNVVTSYVKANGFGGVDMARLQRSSDAVAAAIGLDKAPKASDLFEEGFLPPKAERMMQ